MFNFFSTKLVKSIRLFFGLWKSLINCCPMNNRGKNSNSVGISGIWAKQTFTEFSFTENFTLHSFLIIILTIIFQELPPAILFLIVLFSLSNLSFESGYVNNKFLQFLYQSFSHFLLWVIKNIIKFPVFTGNEYLLNIYQQTYFICIQLMEIY